MLFSLRTIEWKLLLAICCSLGKGYMAIPIVTGSDWLFPAATDITSSALQTSTTAVQGLIGNDLADLSTSVNTTSMLDSLNLSEIVEAFLTDSQTPILSANSTTELEPHFLSYLLNLLGSKLEENRSNSTGWWLSDVAFLFPRQQPNDGVHDIVAHKQLILLPQAMKLFNLLTEEGSAHQVDWQIVNQLKELLVATREESNSLTERDQKSNVADFVAAWVLRGNGDDQRELNITDGPISRIGEDLLHDSPLSNELRAVLAGIGKLTKVDRSFLVDTVGQLVRRHNLPMLLNSLLAVGGETSDVLKDVVVEVGVAESSMVALVGNTLKDIGGVLGRRGPEVGQLPLVVDGDVTTIGEGAKWLVKMGERMGAAELSLGEGLTLLALSHNYLVGVTKRLLEEPSGEGPQFTADLLNVFDLSKMMMLKKWVVNAGLTH